MLALTMVLLAAQATPQQSGVLEGGGIVYGDAVGTMVQAPKGWLFDNKSGVDQGLHAVMYPQGSTWKSAAVVMYVNFGRMQPGESVVRFIDADLAKFREESPGIASSIGKPVPVGRTEQAEVRFYRGDKWGNHEAIAYLPYQSSVIIYVLSSRSERKFRENLTAFRQMVAASAPMVVAVEQKWAIRGVGVVRRRLTTG